MKKIVKHFPLADPRGARDARHQFNFMQFSGKKMPKIISRGALFWVGAPSSLFSKVNHYNISACTDIGPGCLTCSCTRCLTGGPGDDNPVCGTCRPGNYSDDCSVRK